MRTERCITYGEPVPIYRWDVSYGVIVGWRRKRFETWTEDGERIGRWTWEIVS